MTGGLLHSVTGILYQDCFPLCGHLIWAAMGSSQGSQLSTLSQTRIFPTCWAPAAFRNPCRSLLTWRCCTEVWETFSSSSLGSLPVLPPTMPRGTPTLKIPLCKTPPRFPRRGFPSQTGAVTNICALMTTGG